MAMPAPRPTIPRALRASEVGCETPEGDEARALAGVMSGSSAPVGRPARGDITRQGRAPLPKRRSDARGPFAIDAATASDDRLIAHVVERLPRANGL